MFSASAREKPLPSGRGSVTNQITIWRAAEDARIDRWRQDMATSARLLQECENLRHQAEISLALARQSQARNAAPQG